MSSYDITPPVYWEQADWLNLAAGDEISHLEFEDLRKRIWLCERLSAGWRKLDSGDDIFPDSIPGGSGGTIWKYIGELQIIWGGRYWTNWKDITWDAAVNGSARPPDNAHPSPNVWVLKNTYFELAPNPNRYHHWDKNASRWYCNSAQRGSWLFGNFRQWFVDVPSWRQLPQQTDPKEQHRPVVYQDTGRIAWQYKSKVAFDRKHITQPNSLGALYSVYNQIWDATIHRTHHILWSERCLGDQYWHQGGTPGTAFSAVTGAQPPYTGRTSYPNNYNWTWDEKVCDAYQNMIERVCSSSKWMWPTWNPKGDDTPLQAVFQANWLAINDPAGSWDPVTEVAQPWFASITHECWECNESGFEFCLALLEEYDWYFDTTTPHVPWRILKKMYEDANTGAPPLTWAQVRAKWWPPTGTWRRTWKRSFLRRYKTGSRLERMREEGYDPVSDFGGYTDAWIAHTSEHWCGLWAGRPGNYPIPDDTYWDDVSDEENERLDAKHGPVQVEWQGEDDYPEFEIKAEMVIEMREVLAVLRYNQPTDIQVVKRQKVNGALGLFPFSSNQAAYANAYSVWLADYNNDPDTWDAWGAAWQLIGPFTWLVAGGGNYRYEGLGATFQSLDVAFQLSDAGLEDDIFDPFSLMAADEIYIRVQLKGTNRVDDPTEQISPLVVGLGDYSITLPTDDNTTIFNFFVTSTIPKDAEEDIVWIRPILSVPPISPEPLFPPDFSNHRREGRIKLDTPDIVFRVNWNGFPAGVFMRDYTNAIEPERDPENE